MIDRFEEGLAEKLKVLKGNLADFAFQGVAVGYTGIVSLGLTLFLARQLGPEKFGVYSYALTWAALGFILQDGGFKTLLYREGTAPSPGFAASRRDLSALAWGHTLLITLAGVVLGLIIPSPYRLEVAGAILCFGLLALTQFISAELRATGQFPREALWQMQGRTLSAAGILAGLLLLPEPRSVLGGWSLGLLITLFFSPLALPRPRPGALQFREIRSAAFSLMAIDLATTLYNRCDILLLEHLTGNTGEVGVYAAVYRLLDGILLLAAPFNWIWFRKLRMKWEEREGFGRLLLQMCLAMAAVASIILGVGIVGADRLVAVAFGGGYHDAAAVLPWLLLSLIFALPNGILMQAALARNRERFYAVAAGLGAVVNVGLNILLIPTFGAKGAAWATAVTEAVLMIGLLLALSPSSKGLPGQRIKGKLL